MWAEVGFGQTLGVGSVGCGQMLDVGRRWVWVDAGCGWTLGMGRCWVWVDTGYGEMLGVGGRWMWLDTGCGQTLGVGGPNNLHFQECGCVCLQQISLFTVGISYRRRGGEGHWMVASGSRPSLQSFLHFPVLRWCLHQGGAILHKLEKTEEGGCRLCGYEEAFIHAGCRLASGCFRFTPNLSPMLYKPARLPHCFPREAFGLLEY